MWILLTGICCSFSLAKSPGSSVVNVRATSLCSTEICALNSWRFTEVRISMLPKSGVWNPTRSSDWLRPWTNLAVLMDACVAGAASSASGSCAVGAESEITGSLFTGADLVCGAKWARGAAASGALSPGVADGLRSAYGVYFMPMLVFRIA